MSSNTRDLHAELARFDPYPHYARMRAESPVHFNLERQVWEVYGYHDIQTVFGDPATFSSAVCQTPDLVFMDPPRHTHMRRLVARAFTPRLVASLEPSIQAITDGLLDRVADTGRMDVIGDLAFPLPVTVIAELLGLPAADSERFKAWSVPTVQVAEMEMQGLAPEPHLLESVREFTAYLHALILEREYRPQEDLISGLLAEVDGERLTLPDVADICRLLLIGGFETTTAMIGITTRVLLTHPEALNEVRADPTLLPSAIEEALRYQAPSQFFARKATRDVTLGGQSIRAGQQIMIFMASGNRDAEAFPNADRFDVRRTPNRHLSFGHGIHYCLGAGLGRLEGKVAINSLLRRFPEIRLDEERPSEGLSSIILFGLRSLHIRFTPTAAERSSEQP